MNVDERRDDWRHGVDENLASLNAGQRVWEHELGQIRRTLQELDNLLRGDRERDTDGAIARLHQMENSVNLLKAVVLDDAAGNKGLVGRLKVLESGERTSEHRWKFATAVAVAVISLVGLVLSNWDRIGTFLTSGKKDPVEQMIERAKHPKARHRHVTLRAESLYGPEEN